MVLEVTNAGETLVQNRAGDRLSREHWSCQPRVIPCLADDVPT
jgi:hypothetical protein